jgi:hypothetical protein
MNSIRRWGVLLAGAVLMSGMVGAQTGGGSQSTPAMNALIGGWQAQKYFLKNGSEYPLLGQILFTQKNWTVLYLVVVDGKPQRGSGEGGDYTVEGDSVTFIHHFMVSTPADAIPGLKAQPQRSLQWDPPNVEPARFEVKGDQLTLFMPSGNRLTWTRSSH